MPHCSDQCAPACTRWPPGLHLPRSAAGRDAPRHPRARERLSPSNYNDPWPQRRATANPCPLRRTMPTSPVKIRAGRAGAGRYPGNRRAGSPSRTAAGCSQVPICSAGMTQLRSERRAEHPVMRGHDRRAYAPDCRPGGIVRSLSALEGARTLGALPLGYGYLRPRLRAFAPRPGSAPPSAGDQPRCDRSCLSGAWLLSLKGFEVGQPR